MAAILAVGDFRQIAGRAGRKGFDDQGFVIAQAPAHVIENKRAEEKAAGNPQKLRKLVKARAPEGAVSWDANTFARLQAAPPEALASRFSVTHGMLLQVLSRPGDGCRALRQLIADCHETPVKKAALRRRAWQLFRSLVDRRIVEIVPRAERTAPDLKLRVNVTLQEDFSLHQALSLYLLDTVPLLDRASPDYPFDVLTLCEAIVEDPEPILRRQVDRLKTEKLAEMKAAGIEYEERMAKLEEIEHPKPLREFVYETFNAFAASHPWVEGENIRPKSIAREMFERYQSFADYVREYGLERIEGLLLRHLAQVWKVLAQTVPDAAKTEEVVELEVYFRELIRGIDSSLLEEWERMRNPDWVAAEVSADKPARPASFDITRDAAAFRRLVRTEILTWLQDAVRWDAGGRRPADAEDDEAKARAEGCRKFGAYFDARGQCRLDPEGRAAKHTHWVDTEVGAGEWTVAQMLVDSEGHNDWEAVFTVSLAESRAENRAVVRLIEVRAV